MSLFCECVRIVFWSYIYNTHLCNTHTHTHTHTHTDRHYIETKDEPHIALHVYEGGRKQYYPSGALIHSVYRNSPHFLVRLKVPKGDKAFTLVISIYDDTGVLPFTLSSYSAEPAALYAALDCPAVEAKGGHFEKAFRYAWNAETAEGSMTHMYPPPHMTRMLLPII